MSAEKRPTIGLKHEDLVPEGQDRLVEMGVYDALLPCRNFKVDFKVAVLGQVTPSLEFLLRLVKAVPGLADHEIGAYFGYTGSELAYVLAEGDEPGLVERSGGRVWLTAAGEGLFKDGHAQPLIFEVEPRSAQFGFDLLSVAPQNRQYLDEVERSLPELPVAAAIQLGSVAHRIPERVGRFFRELAGRRDRERSQQRDLYSVDAVSPGDRFQVPVRIRALARASSPSSVEGDLRSWKSDHELSDRPEIEQAVAAFVDALRVSKDPVNDARAYQVLIELAPEFLKDFTIRSGLSVNRYWREAISRTGEVRADRQTVPMVGSLLTDASMTKLGQVLDYGMRGMDGRPSLIVSVAPQLACWGASTQLRDVLSMIRRSTQVAEGDTRPGQIEAVCLAVSEPPRHLGKTFDVVHVADSPPFPSRLEIVVVANVAMVALVHAPVGSSSGQPAPLGFTSCDKAVVERASRYVAERLDAYVEAHEEAVRYVAALTKLDARS